MENNPLEELQRIAVEVAELRRYLESHPEELEELLPRIEALIVELDNLKDTE